MIVTTKEENNWAVFAHLSLFSGYFIPVGGYIVPIVLWVLKKDESVFIKHNAQEAINFQLSLLLYSILIGIVLLPFSIFQIFDLGSWNNFNFSLNVGGDFSSLGGFLGFGIFWGILFLVKIGLVIKAVMETKEGKMFYYPFTIKFLK